MMWTIGPEVTIFNPDRDESMTAAWRNRHLDAGRTPGPRSARRRASPTTEQELFDGATGE